jgi:hypothetical protein
VPLPYLPWLERPESLPLDVDEIATALFLAHGNVAGASELLKVPQSRLKRPIRKSLYLQRLISRLGAPEEQS